MTTPSPTERPGPVTDEHAVRLELAAVFHPRTTPDTMPALEMAGVLISVYLDRVSGILRVHVDTETSHLPADADAVPYAVIEVNEGAVWVNAPDHCPRCGAHDTEPHGPDCGGEAPARPFR